MLSRDLETKIHSRVGTAHVGFSTLYPNVIHSCTALKDGNAQQLMDIPLACACKVGILVLGLLESGWSFHRTYPTPSADA